MTPTNNNNDSFFAEPVTLEQEARALASEALSRLLIWFADAPSAQARGDRVMAALYCVRPDLINGLTLEQMGEISGCSRQAMHRLVNDFRQTMGF